MYRNICFRSWATSHPMTLGSRKGAHAQYLLYFRERITLVRNHCNSKKDIIKNRHRSERKGMKQEGKYFSLMYLFSYAAIGALFPLIAQYLSSLGFSGTEIGIVTSSSTAVGILANSFWGRIYHDRGCKKDLVIMLSILTALLSLFLMIIRQFSLFLIVYIIVFFFENPVYPFVDATVMEADYPFGKARKWGALGFATGIGVAGYVADNLGLLSIFPMYCIFFCLNAFLFFMYSRGKNLGGCGINGRHGLHTPDERGSHRQHREGYKTLLSNRQYLGLLLSTFFFNGPALSHNTYFSFLYLNAGGTLAGMGLVLLLMVVSEAPVMAMAYRISNLFTMEKAILIGMSVSALRFFWYGFNPPVYLLAATFFLQGIANGIVLVETVRYIERLVGTEMLSLALPLFTAISSNSGTIVCQFLGGVIVGIFGGKEVYLFYSLLNLVAIVIYIFAGLHKVKKLN